MSTRTAKTKPSRPFRSSPDAIDEILSGYGPRGRDGTIPDRRANPVDRPVTPARHRWGANLVNCARFTICIDSPYDEGAHPGCHDGCHAYWARIHRLAIVGKVQFTEKALEELRALPLGISVEDAHHILENLTANECAGRLVSREAEEWLYVFKPQIAGTVLYVKVVLRADCVVISFHEEGGDDPDEGEDQEA